MKALLIRDADLYRCNILYLRVRFQQYLANPDPQLMIKYYDYHPGGYTYAIPEQNPYYIVLKFFNVGELCEFPDEDKL